MHHLIQSIDITYDESTDIIYLDIKDVDDEEANISAKVLGEDKTFRFSYVHPETKLKHKYKGIIDGKKVHIYPIIGRAVISNEALTYGSKQED